MEKEKEVRLWNNGSHMAKRLKEELKEAGYNVKSFFSGCSKPRAFSKNHFEVGFTDIRLHYLN